MTGQVVPAATVSTQRTDTMAATRKTVRQAQPPKRPVSNIRARDSLSSSRRVMRSEPVKPKDNNISPLPKDFFWRGIQSHRFLRRSGPSPAEANARCSHRLLTQIQCGQAARAPTGAVWGARNRGFGRTALESEAFAGFKNPPRPSVWLVAIWTIQKWRIMPKMIRSVDLTAHRN